jgi:UPF0755 protein
MGHSNAGPSGLLYFIRKNRLRASRTLAGRQNPNHRMIPIAIAKISTLKRAIFTLAAVLLVMLLVIFGVYLDLIIYSGKPAGNDSLKQAFVVARGQKFIVTADKLHKTGLIKHPLKFRLFARMKNLDTRIQAGEYLLSPTMSPNAILETLVQGKVNLHKITIPEGLNIYQIAAIAGEAGFGTKTDFIRSATDKRYLRKQAIEADTFEGYLFPDTYYFPKDETPHKIIYTMVERFWAKFKPEWILRSQELGFTIHQVVTLASIIEKETGAAFERPIISSVFHNRLKKGMRLESDPTVIYGLKDFDGNLTRKHLTTKTPYNTYKIKGLPPGPIANPGIASIKAALYPADTDYLFFVSKKDKTHQFSTNLKDHNKAIRKYQLRR